MAHGTSPEEVVMPYEIKAGENGTYEVVNKESGAVKAVHQPPDAKEKAERQVKLLHEVEGEWDNDGSD